MMDREAFDDALAELVNIGVGKAASLLSSMVAERIELSVPKVTQVSYPELADHLEIEDLDHLSLVQQGFSGKVGGSASILFPLDSARRLVELLTGGALTSEELDLEREAALTEVGNILINGVMGTIANITKVDLQYHLPEYLECPSEELGRTFRNKEILLAVVLIAISGQEIKGHLVLFFDLPSMEALQGIVGDMMDEGG